MRGVVDKHMSVASLSPFSSSSSSTLLPLPALNSSLLIFVFVTRKSSQLILLPMKPYCNEGERVELDSDG